MAGYTPNYGAGAPGDARPPYRSYYDYMSSTFVDHFNTLPARLHAGEEPPRPLDSERYYDDYDSDQSGTCAQQAVEFYNQQQGNYSAITLERAKDSHKFFSEGTAYFHVNFKAAFGGGSGPCYTFFAEVKGPGVPESVTMVVQFHTKEERRTRDNCLYCTGLRHPEQGGFVGHCRLPHHQDYPSQAADDGDEMADGDEDDEEAGGDGEADDEEGTDGSGGSDGDEEDSEDDDNSSDDEEDESCSGQDEDETKASMAHGDRKTPSQF